MGEKQNLHKQDEQRTGMKGEALKGREKGREGRGGRRNERRANKGGEVGGTRVRVKNQGEHK